VAAQAIVRPLLILSGGVLAFWGSNQPWGICPHDPCESYGGLQHLVTKFGFEYGTGVATAVVALALVLIGVAAFGLGGSPAIRRAAAGLAIVELILASVHVARVHVFAEFLTYGPQPGLVAVIAGGAVSLAGAALLPRRSSERRT
jgi:hypothetical protein